MRQFYQHKYLIRKLIYLTIIKSDINFAISMVSRFMKNPKVCHWKAILLILHYVKNSPGKEIIYRNHSHLDIVVYYDTNYVDSRFNQCSTTDYCTFVEDNIVSSRSKK